ncbi:hypothetical protein [Methylocystis sp.]|uniref:hypothetical protein n=1 Tax=Methylocystis sp. TaxID=1911079 RepID=UPI003D0B0F76
MALIFLSQLRNLAAVHRKYGEILDNAAWLRVNANIWSSAPEGYIGSRRGDRAPLYFGLTFENLKNQALACGLDASDEEIEEQVADTRAWRRKRSEQVGAPFYRRMKPDKIGRLLGVVEATREEAGAWNIGTYGGSRAERIAAAKERDKARKAHQRRASGVQTREERYAVNLTKSRPWVDEGISRRTWERRRSRERAENDAAASATYSVHPDVTQPVPPQPNPRPIVERDAAESATFSLIGLPPQDFRKPTRQRALERTDSLGLPDSEPKDFANEFSEEAAEDVPHEIEIEI